MRILQLTKNYPPDSGGIESVTFDIAEGLRDEGIQSDVLCSSNNNRSFTEERSGYRIFRTATLFQSHATSVSTALVAMLHKLRQNYDIIHVHFPNPMAALALFLVRPEKPIVIHWHSDIIRQKKLYPFFKPLEQWALRRAKAVIVTSENYPSHSKPLKPFLNKVKVLPIGISTDSLQYKEEDVLSIKEQYKEKKIVFSLGRMVYYKGFEYLIEASHYLEDDVMILLGGTGEMKSELEEMVRKNGYGKNVKLLGYIPADKLGAYYQACDVFCLPSTHRSEAFGVVQLEAMYFAKPLVATNIAGSGVNWVNQHEVTGYNVGVQDAKGLAEAIKKILSNPTEQQRFSDNAKKRFEEYFTRKKMISALIEIYEGCL